MTQRLIAFLGIGFIASLLFSGWQQAIASDLSEGHSGQIGRPVQVRIPVQDEDEPAIDQGRYIVYLAEQLRPDQLNPTGAPLGRRTAIISQLQDVADATQSRVMGHLEDGRQLGRVNSIQPLWIINAIVVEGESAWIEDLSSFPEVDRVEIDQVYAELAQADASFFEPFGVSAQTPVSGNYGIQQIHADGVWHALGITGTGATVAIVDSGVDWTHPDLQENYRGNTPSGVTHAGNWFHAAYPTRTTPADFEWHGTHVAGSAIGQSGIGVAPGADWIGVSIVNDSGQIFTSYIYAAFEWLLAPNGDPALAPDVINGSWGGSGSFDLFVPEIELLRNAGIVPVFAAGNSGPYTGTINYPASYTNTIAVAATDDQARITWFSSRGPSPLTADQKPEVAAPGANIYSTYPDGRYAFASGTSMATPHVAGLVALMRSADPTITVEEVEQILIDTVQSIQPTAPTISGGYGLVDAYQAVAALSDFGLIRGSVTAEGQPIIGEAITLSQATAAPIALTTDENGEFAFPVQSGTYSLTVAPFGFLPAVVPAISISGVQTRTEAIVLTRVASGQLTGQLTLNGDGQPGIISLEQDGGELLAIDSDSIGQFSNFVPAGTYSLVARSVGAAIYTQSLTIIQGETLTLPIALDPADRVLLVDAGGYGYDPAVNYYVDAFRGLAIEPAVWEIYNPLTEVPSVETMLEYDKVIWADPMNSPADLQAGEIISGYLDAGGKLLVSGRNVAQSEAYGDLYQWLYTHLYVIWQGQVEPAPLEGVFESAYAGMTVTLNGGDGADNQETVGAVAPRNPFVPAEPILTTADGDIVGVHTGHCRPYELVFFGFGLEGVSTQAQREETLQTALTLLDTPAQTSGVRWLDSQIRDFAAQGELYTYTLWIQNMSESITDTLRIEASGGEWETSVLTSSVKLGPCGFGQVDLTVQVPEELGSNVTHEVVFEVRSAADVQQVDLLTMTHKTAGTVLLVNDHRWFDESDHYKSALEAIGIDFDIWETHQGLQRGSPPIELMNAYEVVVWFTGYDWFAPITLAERDNLVRYLDQGGRLFLSSQDFLNYNANSELAYGYFGIDGYIESLTPTLLYAAEVPFTGSRWQNPEETDELPYFNNGDVVVPGQDAQPLMLSQSGPIMVGHQNRGDGDAWRTVFMAAGFELLPEEQQQSTLENILSWLGPFGDSNIALSGQVGNPSDWVTTTVLIDYEGGQSGNPFTLTVSLADAFLPELGALPAGLTYSPTQHAMTWDDTLTEAGSITLTFRSQISPTAAAYDHLTQTMFLDDGRFVSEKTIGLWVSAPDFSRSTIDLESNAPHPLTNTLTMTLSLVNSGLTATQGLSTGVSIPEGVIPITGSLEASAGVGGLQPGLLIWNGDLAQGETVTVTLNLTKTQSALSHWLVFSMPITESQVGHTLKYNASIFESYEIWTPWIFSEASVFP